jgi:hypothetical protein
MTHMAHGGKDTNGASSMRLALAPTDEPLAAEFTLNVQHIGKLDRFIGQAQRAAVLAEREFEGVLIEVDAEGTVSVHAAGIRSMLL